MNATDKKIRHYIYSRFAKTTQPPTPLMVAERFDISIAAVEQSLNRLAKAHQIALAPGSYSIWMAHPFSGIPTHYVAEIENKRYSGN